MSRNLSPKSRYAVILILLGLVALMEARHPSFRLATFIVAFLALAGMASLLRVRPFHCRSYSHDFRLPGIGCFANGFTVPQPVIGLGPEHAGRFHAERTDPKSGIPIYSADYTIDSNLLRETHSVETGPTIGFFGDSFTFGEGLNDADTLPQQLADLLGRKQRVLNLGYPGYGPQHEGTTGMAKLFGQINKN